MRSEVHTEDMMKCPKGIPLKEWEEACKRAKRAQKYAVAMLGQEEGTINISVERFQDPLWQWENEVRGRFGGIVGGSLSGTRSHPEGN